MVNYKLIQNQGLNGILNIIYSSTKNYWKIYKIRLKLSSVKVNKQTKNMNRAAAEKYGQN